VTNPADAAPGSELYARLFEALPEGVYIGCLQADRTVTLAANPHLRVMFGWDHVVPAAEVRPFDPDRFVDEQARQAFLQQLARDGATRDYPLRLRRADGAALWVEVTARAEGEAYTDAWRIEAVMRDVTELRKRQEETRDIQYQHAQAERLAALDQALSGAAHELNNPLQIILACAERLAERRLDERTRRDFDAIHSAAERAARIVRILLMKARKGQTTRTTVDLNEILRETLVIRLHDQRAANVVILEALAAGLPPIFADPHQIQQILLNLIINAEQAMLDAHGRGTLILRSWHDPDRDAVILEVNDDGPGVPEETQPKIFDPLFTTKAVGKGTGLGLFMSYGIAQEHGGRLTVKSPEGEGASFFLELPVSGANVRVPEPVRAAPLPDVPAGTRALVIEDEKALNEAVAAALADEGFEVDRAANGEEALSRLAERPYDLVICDLKMPKMNGMAFFREVSAHMPQIARRIVFVTGDVAGTEAERFLEDSGCRWVPKPFRLRDLVRVARETLQ
jgi:signal transduction histidine kinase